MIGQPNIANPVVVYAIIMTAVIIIIGEWMEERKSLEEGKYKSGGGELDVYDG